MRFIKRTISFFMAVNMLLGNTQVAVQRIRSGGNSPDYKKRGNPDEVRAQLRQLVSAANRNH